MNDRTDNKRSAFLKIHPEDNVLVALNDLETGTMIPYGEKTITLKSFVQAKHKFTTSGLLAGDPIYMYGVLVGRASRAIPEGTAINIHNVRHDTQDYSMGHRKTSWSPPPIECWTEKTFMGYHRSNGTVGTANYWLVIPLVFCENRNVDVLKQALETNLGFKNPSEYDAEVGSLINMYKTGRSVEDILNADLEIENPGRSKERLFPNIDGVKFLNHHQGCGGTKADAEALCGLLAGYITHSNVAGATILSLGCQHAQADILKKEITQRDPGFDKPLIVLEHQQIGTENKLLKEALKRTFAGLITADVQVRKPAPLSKLCIGLECGGSDGFSGISANPAVGYLSDIIVALGGSVILAEFPELCGVEQEMSDRCEDDTKATKFIKLMRDYNARAEAVGSGFYANPSPGNIRDGLITDAIKSAGAAKKGGTSPVTDVLDYPEKVTRSGLNLLCTPGSDVESTTAEVGAGANIVLFTTGLGTPTGNPIAPVIKLSSNSKLAKKMPDIIDIDCGTIIEGLESIPDAAGRILDYVLEVASGMKLTKSTVLGQDDFIPWKRGVSL